MKLAAIILAVWAIGTVALANHAYTQAIDALRGVPHVVRG